MKQQEVGNKKYEIAKKTRHFYLTLKGTN